MATPYDFQNLSFDDFERLCADLLQVRLGVNLESFKVGRDRGIDLRFAPSTDGTLIVQCKRYSPAAFSRLRRDIESKELPKVKALAPERYILCTSCLLSPDQKDSLQKILAPYCGSTEDILGADELNRLISANEEIERRHFKLWLGSTAILQRVLHAGVFAYSQNELDSLRNEVSRYVVHEGFYRALNLLDQSHHCIIVGIPGVGKTIAARLLLAHYIREDFEVISITRDIEDAWSVIDRDENAKVVIYYDDFLGQMTRSEKLSKNEDRRLLEMIAHCKKSKNKRFILTTRDYIFDQALNAHEPLGRAHDELLRSSIRLDDYGIVIRARLLANHLQFSSVGRNSLNELVKTRSYEKILHHQNFLPRVIEQICRGKGVENLEPSLFISNALDLLNNPSEVWKRPFQQLTNDARLLLYALASLDGEHEMGRLEVAWRAFCKYIGHSIDRYYIDVLREVDGSFSHSQMHPPLKGGTEQNGTIVKFINPSAREYVLTDLISKPDFFSAAINSAIAFEQLLFWQEARTSFVGTLPYQLASPFAEQIAKKSLELLSISKPEVTPWAGQLRIKWKPAPKKISRLNAIFQALQRMNRKDLIRSIVRSQFSSNLAEFSTYLRHDDLLWASDVLKITLTVLERYENSNVESACEILDITRWAEHAQDFQGIRHIWETAGLAIQSSDDSSNWDDRVRDALVRKTRELCNAIPIAWSGDDISHEADELELVVIELGDSLSMDLQRLRDRAIEEPPSEEDGVEVHLSSRYRRRNRAEVESDVDDIFSNLISQIEAESDDI